MCCNCRFRQLVQLRRVEYIPSFLMETLSDKLFNDALCAQLTLIESKK